ncbi:MAG TPA: YeiH family protein [Verrucomicrobiae bacterium]
MEPMQKSGVDYSWAEYLGCMEGIPEDVPVAKSHSRSIAWGLAVCLAVTLGSLWLSTAPFWPFTVQGGRHLVEPMLLAMVIGMILSNAWTMPKLVSPGIRYSYKVLLSLGIVLLGVQLNFIDVMKLGGVGVLLSCLEIVMALGFMWLLTHSLKLSGKLGILLGVGTAICGSSAIIATAPVIEAEEKDVVFGVAAVTLLGLVGMIALPIVGHALSLTPRAFGILDGLVIHSIPQVVTAGFAYSPDAGATATIVKMTRVCLLAPMVLAVGLVYARQKARHAQAANHKRFQAFSLFPKFVFGFLAMALLRTLGWLPDLTVHLPSAAWAGDVRQNLDLGECAHKCSTFFLGMSMAAVGLETKVSALRRTGLKPLLAGFISSVAIAIAILVLIKLLGIA